MTCNNPNLDLVNINAYIEFVKICIHVLKILSGNEFWHKSRGHNSGANMRKRTCSSLKTELVNVNAYIKFGENLSICFQDIERKRKFGVNQGPQLWYKYAKKDV